MADYCNICGAANAPFGFRRAGLLSELADKRSLWSCAACIPAAEARWRSANDPTAAAAGKQAGAGATTDEVGSRNRGRSARRDAPNPEQRSLI